MLGKLSTTELLKPVLYNFISLKRLKSVYNHTSRYYINHLFSCIFKIIIVIAECYNIKLYVYYIPIKLFLEISIKGTKKLTKFI